jgi:uncharacterized protein
MLNNHFFYIVTLPAILLLGLGKGGFAGVGLLALPLVSLSVPPLQAASILLPLSIAQDMVCVWVYRNSWEGRSLAILLPGAVVGVVVGYAVAAIVSSATVGIVLGITATAFGAYQLKYSHRKEFRAIDMPDHIGIICGIASGFTSQIANAGLVPFQIYMLPRRLPKEMLIGTGTIFFGSVNLFKVPAFFALGQFTRQNLMTAAVLLPVALSSSLLGTNLARRVSGEKLYGLIFLLLVLVGLKLCWDGVRTIALK